MPVHGGFISVGAASPAEIGLSRMRQERCPFSSAGTGYGFELLW
jgi:hypothetical protein